MADTATLIQHIQAILAPAVMVSACGLLLLGMQNKYGRIIDRMRILTRERLALLGQGGEPLAAERLPVIDRQIRDLLRRTRIQHDAVLLLFLAVGLFVLDMLLIGGINLFPGLHVVPLAVFVLGQLMVLLSAILAGREIWISHRAAILDASEALKLPRQSR
jgi:hypothetical protein